MTSVSSKLEFPSEILGLTFCHVAKEDLKSIRLVCKAFEQAALPFLFDEVYLSTNLTDLEVAHLTVTHFIASIGKAIISTVYKLSTP